MSIELSAGDFVRFQRSSARAKRSLISTFKKRAHDTYDPGTDNFRRVRQAIQREAVPDEATPDAFARAIVGLREYRHERFRRLLDGYLRFASTRDLARLRVPRLVWSFQDLQITVRPHLALSIGGGPHLIRFLYGSQPPNRHLVCALIQMLDEARGDKDGRPALLDLWRGGLLCPRPSASFASLLRAEAAELIRLWGPRQ